MPETTHEKRLKKIEAETLEIKKEIMQLEFQHKKDHITAQKEADQRQKEADERAKRMDLHLKHLSKLMGITYEELENLDSKIQNAGQILARRRKPSIPA